MEVAARVNSQERGAVFEQRFEAAVRRGGGGIWRMPKESGCDYLVTLNGDTFPAECKALDGNRIRLKNFTKAELLLAETIVLHGGRYWIYFPYFGYICRTDYGQIRRPLMRKSTVNLENCRDMTFTL